MDSLDARALIEKILAEFDEPTGIEEISFSPSEFRLYDAYPNPFNSSVTIRYVIPVNAVVSLKIYDVLGREVKTLVEEEQSAGLKSTVWKAEDQSTGIYFYRLGVHPRSPAGHSRVQTKKLLLVK
jgi:hypothetical protein